MPHPGAQRGDKEEKTGQNQLSKSRGEKGGVSQSSEFTEIGCIIQVGSLNDKATGAWGKAPSRIQERGVRLLDSDSKMGNSGENSFLKGGGGKDLARKPSRENPLSALGRSTREKGEGGAPSGLK